MEKFILKLYVTKDSTRSPAAEKNIKEVCDQYLEGQFRLQIIDVDEQPEMVEADQVLAVPLLIKEAPPPVRRLIGDMSDHERVLLCLEISDNS